LIVPVDAYSPNKIVNLALSEFEANGYALELDIMGRLSFLEPTPGDALLTFMRGKECDNALLPALDSYVLSDLGGGTRAKTSTMGSNGGGISIGRSGVA
jgi:hypothetical protein